MSVCMAPTVGAAHYGVYTSVPLKFGRFGGFYYILAGEPGKTKARINTVYRILKELAPNGVGS